MAVSAHTPAVIGNTAFGLSTCGSGVSITATGKTDIGVGSTNAVTFPFTQTSFYIVANTTGSQIALSIEATATQDQKDAGLDITDKSVHIEGNCTCILRPFTALKDATGNVKIFAAATGLQVQAFR